MSAMGRAGSGSQFVMQNTVELAIPYETFVKMRGCRTKVDRSVMQDAATQIRCIFPDPDIFAFDTVREGSFHSQ